MKNITDRVEQMKQGITKKREKNHVNSDIQKASSFKTALMTGLVFVASAIGFKTSAQTMTESNDSIKNQTEINENPNYNTNRDTVDFIANADTAYNPDDDIKARAAELASDVDFMVNFLIEEGENRFDNFNFSNEPMTEEILSELEESDFCNKLQAAGKKCRSNYNGRLCYHGTKDILRSVGISLSGRHAYMASSQLEKLDEFVEVNCSYAMLKHCPNGTIVVQEKGSTTSGHIFVIGENNRGEKVQWCGREYKLPVNNRRGSTGQKYGKLRVFIPADCLTSFDLTADLYEKGCFKNTVEDMLIPVIKKQENDLENRKVITAKADILKDTGKISLKIDDKNRPNLTTNQNSKANTVYRKTKPNKSPAAFYNSRKNTYS